MKKQKLIVSIIIVFSSLFYSNQARSGTAAYFAKCSYKDHLNNNGGSISSMPCYIVEGGNVNSAFYHILWRDGVKTRLDTLSSEKFFRDRTTGRAYQRFGNNTFITTNDGDRISVNDVQYINDRYNIDENATTLLTMLSLGQDLSKSFRTKCWAGTLRNQKYFDVNHEYDCTLVYREAGGERYEFLMIETDFKFYMVSGDHERPWGVESNSLPNGFGSQCSIMGNLATRYRPIEFFKMKDNILYAVRVGMDCHYLNQKVESVDEIIN